MTLEALLAIPESLICSIAVTPTCIARMSLSSIDEEPPLITYTELYNVTKATKAAAGNQLGIFEDLGDVYSQTDLDLFFATFAQ
jgi:tripeptidyl-peptidase-1